jgi:hypothetical protein
MNPISLSIGRVAKKRWEFLIYNSHYDFTDIDAVHTSEERFPLHIKG